MTRSPQDFFFRDATGNDISSLTWLATFILLFAILHSLNIISHRPRVPQLANYPLFHLARLSCILPGISPPTMTTFVPRNCGNIAFTRISHRPVPSVRNVHPLLHHVRRLTPTALPFSPTGSGLAIILTQWEPVRLVNGSRPALVPHGGHSDGSPTPNRRRVLSVMERPVLSANWQRHPNDPTRWTCASRRADLL